MSRQTILRQYTPFDLVQLPRVDIGGARALATQLLAAADGQILPAAVDEAVTEVRVALDQLRRIVGQQPPTSAGREPRAVQLIDARVHSCWAALYNWCVGWARLPDAREAEKANYVLKTIFPEGFSFIELDYRSEWAESDMRMKLLDEGLDSAVIELGGGKIVKKLREAHRDYGNALGSTIARTADESATVRKALANLAEALRSYVVQATALQRKNNPKTIELSKRLLEPVVRWGGAPPIADVTLVTGEAPADR